MTKDPRPRWGRLRPRRSPHAASASSLSYGDRKAVARIAAAIEGAVAWLKSVAIPGLRYETFNGADGQRDRRVVADPSTGPLWARFYEIGTNRPIFLGRDSVVRYALSEIERERRAGYAYYGTWPASLLDADFPRWRSTHRR